MVRPAGEVIVDGTNVCRFAYRILGSDIKYRMALLRDCGATGFTVVSELLHETRLRRWPAP